jgi:hypothetical protein
LAGILLSVLALTGLPKVLSDHKFSADEISANFDILLLDPTTTSGWQTMQGEGQTEFQPLYAYFIDNKTHTIININYIGDSVFDVTNTNTHKYIKTSIPQIICTRLKEREGVLKFYTNIEIPIIQGMIFFAEQLCYNMCEFCGCTEELGETDGWKKICCKNCCKKDITWKKRY